MNDSAEGRSDDPTAPQDQPPAGPPPHPDAPAAADAGDRPTTSSSTTPTGGKSREGYEPL